MAGGDVVTPWEVNAGENGVDYNKLLVDFNSTRIDKELIERFERLTNRKIHHFLERDIFYSHRELNEILDLYEQGYEKFKYKIHS